MTSAERFQEALQSFDPLLSLRWGNVINQWVIQRKSVVREDEIKFLKHERERMESRIRLGRASENDMTRYPGIAEELECALQQCRVILFVKEFTPEIFNILALGDMQRYGGYARYHDEQDQRMILEENKRQREKENKLNDLNMEIWGKNGVYDFIKDKKMTGFNERKSVKELLGWKRAPWEKEEFKGILDQFGKRVV